MIVLTELVCRAAGAGRLQALIDRQFALRRGEPDKPRIKVNLYTADEVHAVACAAACVAAAGEPSRIDCLMVADSYLMTHLGASSTRLATAADRAALLDTMVTLVRAVADAARTALWPSERPWILGDMPDGSVAGIDAALRNIERMLEAGADCVKIELGEPGILHIVERAADRGLPVVAHLGYQPQFGDNRRYGATMTEAQALFAQARRARDAGATALVLERVAEPVNARLCAPSRQGLPVYSIFSGRVRWGGQSLNVWDAVFRPPFPAIHFPPTATLERSDYPARYTVPMIADHFAQLLALTYAGRFPITAVKDDERGALAFLPEIDPWVASRSRETVGAMV